MTALKRARGLCLAAAMLICLALALPAAGVAAAAQTYTPENVQAFESQLDRGEIVSATFNKRLGRVHVTLKNGRLFYYHYPKKGSGKVKEQLEAKHVPVTVLTPTEATKEAAKPHHHKIRYIVGGVLIVVIIVVGGVLLVRRRRIQD